MAAILVPLLHLVSHLLDHSCFALLTNSSRVSWQFQPSGSPCNLLLMSYGKILQAIITPLSWGYLTYMYTDTVEKSRAIWLYDGNIGFLSDPGHIVLAVFAILMLLCLFLPYNFYSTVWSLSSSLVTPDQSFLMDQ